MRLQIDIDNASSDDQHPSPEEFQRWAELAIGDSRERAELSLRLVDEPEMAELNQHYRNKAGSTNVLSFPAELPDYIDEPLLGDLVICSAVVRREALEQGKACRDHWAHMVIHGTLHLLGYDHIDEQQAQAMETLEIELLASIGLNNPYETASH